MLLSSKSRGQGMRGSSRISSNSCDCGTSKRGRCSSILKQTTLDSLRICSSERFAPAFASVTFQHKGDDEVESLSSGEPEIFEKNETAENFEPEESHLVREQKRAAPSLLWD